MIECNRWRKVRRESIRWKEIALRNPTEERREKREPALPAARVRSVFSLASGLESRGGTDRSSIGRLLVPPPVTLYHEAQRRKLVARRALGVKPGCQCVSEIFGNRWTYLDAADRRICSSTFLNYAEVRPELYVKTSTRNFLIYHQWIVAELREVLILGTRNW